MNLPWANLTINQFQILFYWLDFSMEQNQALWEMHLRFQYNKWRPEDEGLE